MSTAAGVLARPQGGSQWLSRLLVALLAVALVAAALAFLEWALAPDAAPRPPARNPFGGGMVRETPAAGLFGWILGVQASFYRALQGALSALRREGGEVWPLIGLGFAYGVFHAAGPGHGKAVIAAYLVATGRQLRRAVTLSLGAALVQAGVALVLVGLLAGLLNATRATMDGATRIVELGSFGAVALLGVVLLWRKAGKLVGLGALAAGRDAPPEIACDHVHLPPPERLERLGGWRETCGVVLAAGIRPCGGALVVLVFALSQGLVAAGVAAVFAMAVGTALTTGAIAALAVFGKGLALRLAGGRGQGGALVLAGIEVLAAAFVTVLGLSLVTGLMAGSA